jgi:hypothetical protein
MSMGVYRTRQARLAIALVLGMSAFAGCGGGGGNAQTSAPAAAVLPVAGATTPAAGPAPAPLVSPVVKSSPVIAPSGIRRAGFLGAFFRPEGPPPFGIFLAGSNSVAPNPYPTPGGTLQGPGGYCGQVAANGVSIETGNPVDPTKLADITGLGVRWTRMPAPQFVDDLTHVFGPGQFAWGNFDAAQCVTLADHGIRPVVNLEAGPVQYSATIGQLPPQSVPLYQTPSDFGQWCGAVAAHERSTFPSVTQFSLPGNEVNTNPQLFPGGQAQIASYSEACYAAVKAAYPSAYVYGFELNVDGQVNAPGFVRQMAALGCGVGTCYDGIAMHLSLRYPVPPASTPCYPNPGGDYSLQCVADIQSAAGAPVHVLISESVYAIPENVPDEATKALAVVADMTALAGLSSVDGVAYADVDECPLYVGTAFQNGCLINASGQQLPAYGALEALATADFQ